MSTPKDKEVRERFEKEFINVGWIPENKAHILSFILTEITKAREGYDELIFAVGRKYEGETRHETALRYIKIAEQSEGEVKSSLLSSINEKE